jgi:hypothetical protein
VLFVNHFGAADAWVRCRSRAERIVQVTGITYGKPPAVLRRGVYGGAKRTPCGRFKGIGITAFRRLFLTVFDRVLAGAIGLFVGHVRRPF